MSETDDDPPPPPRRKPMAEVERSEDLAPGNQRFVKQRLARSVKPGLNRKNRTIH